MRNCAPLSRSFPIGSVWFTATFPSIRRATAASSGPFTSLPVGPRTLAECAGHAGRFWDANDTLFELSNSLDTQSTKKIAAELKLDPAALDRCMKDEGLADVKNDVEVGIALKLEGTPSFLVDGQVYMGNLPASVLERLRVAPDANQ